MLLSGTLNHKFVKSDTLDSFLDGELFLQESLSINRKLGHSLPDELLYV
jgi:hypothetical protein